MPLFGFLDQIGLPKNYLYPNQYINFGHMANIPMDASPVEKVLFRKGGSAAAAAMKMYKMRTRKDWSTDTIRPPRQLPPPTPREPTPTPKEIEEQRRGAMFDISRAKKDVIKLDKQIQEISASLHQAYTIDGKQITKQEVITNLNQYKKDMNLFLKDSRKYASEIKRYQTSLVAVIPPMPTTDAAKLTWYKQYATFQDETGKTKTWKELEATGLIMEIKNGKINVRYQTELELGKSSYNTLVSNYMVGGRSREEAERLTNVRLGAVSFMESPLAIDTLIDTLTVKADKDILAQYNMFLKDGRAKNIDEYVDLILPKYTWGTAQDKKARNDKRKQVKDTLTRLLVSPSNYKQVLYRLAIADLGYQEALKKGGLDFAGKVATSPAMVEGVYLPLATMGIGYGVGGALGYATEYGGQLVKVGTTAGALGTYAAPIGKGLQLTAKAAGITLLGMGVHATASELERASKKQTYTMIKTPEGVIPYDPKRELKPGEQIFTTSTRGGLGDLTKVGYRVALLWGAGAIGGKAGYQYGMTKGSQVSLKELDPFGFNKLTPKEAKSLYRKLSLKYHPDKPGGNHDAFVLLSKSYAAYGGKPVPLTAKLMKSFVTFKATLKTWFAPSRAPGTSRALTVYKQGVLAKPAKVRPVGARLTATLAGQKFTPLESIMPKAVIARGVQVPTIPAEPKGTLISRMRAQFPVDPTTGKVMVWHATTEKLTTFFRRRVTLVNENPKRKGEFLMASHTKSGKPTYMLPGGEANPGETDFMALNREVGEEAGVRIKRDTVKYLGEYLDIESGNLYVNYEASLTGIPTKTGETTHLGYFKKGTSNRLAEHVRPILEKYLAKDFSEVKTLTLKKGEFIVGKGKRGPPGLHFGPDPPLWATGLDKVPKPTVEYTWGAGKRAPRFLKGAFEPDSVGKRVPAKYREGREQYSHYLYKPKTKPELYITYKTEKGIVGKHRGVEKEQIYPIGGGLRVHPSTFPFEPGSALTTMRAKVWDKWGDWVARRTGYREYTIHPLTRTKIPIQKTEPFIPKYDAAGRPITPKPKERITPEGMKDYYKAWDDYYKGIRYESKASLGYVESKTPAVAEKYPLYHGYRPYAPAYKPSQYKAYKPAYKPPKYKPYIPKYKPPSYKAPYYPSKYPAYTPPYKYPSYKPPRYPPPRYPYKYPTPIHPIPPPIIPPIIKTKKPPKFEKPANIAYDVYVKREQRYHKITDKPLSKTHALGLGSIVVDKTRSEHFKLKKKLVTPTPLPRYDKTWKEIGHKFKKINDVYKEKHAYIRDYDIERRKYIKPKFKFFGRKKPKKKRRKK